MIELTDVTYWYHKNRKALDDTTARIDEGIYLLLGENGAGKTTLLEIIAGLLFPRSGCCTVNGSDISKREPWALQQIFMLSDTAELPCRTINEFKRIHAPLYPTFSDEDLIQNLADMGLTGDEPMKSLSFGTRKKAAIAYVLALHCPITLLDEPVNGLDINAKKQLRHMMARTLHPGDTIIVSTHTVWDLEQLFDGVILLKNGQIALDAKVMHLLDRISFVKSISPIAEAVYQEPGLDGYHAIVAANDDTESAMDFNLLYSALMSDKAPAVLQLING